MRTYRWPYEPCVHDNGECHGGGGGDIDVVIHNVNMPDLPCSIYLLKTTGGSRGFLPYRKSDRSTDGQTDG